MNSTIKSHKELQIHLFLAVIEGLRAGFCNREFFITSQDRHDHFTFELWRYAQKDKDGYEVLRHEVNKGEYQMNDNRLNVITKYISNEAEKFMKDVNKFLANEATQEVQDIPTFEGTLDKLKEL